ncbi:Hypp5591 [Branchiostoma lanceolatum]|uniref:Hypp5591 protein n=1 Tax=Branchiostoma lanceolatum TaxID=7740 RepID=A0A8J9VEP5_BRALA|nr:Hypp5591 [Branchiostoma lanceolatum]
MAALLKLSGDVEENPGPPKLSEKPETIEDWDPARLKLWLQDNGLDQKYCDRMCQEEKRQEEHEDDSDSEDRERIRLEDLKKQQDKLNKKLQSIKDLKARRRSGETLERNQIDKIKDEKNVRRQLQEVIKKIEGHWMEQNDDDFY